ncbi:aminomethyl-transferring glycine dehydrogenase subunit GcvPA [Acidobacteriota bacterium]
MSYISLSDNDIQKMLAKIGISSIEELFNSIPEDIKLNRALKVPGPLSEPEVLTYFQKLAKKNSSPDILTFLGAGAYSHLIPSVVDSLSQRGEFVSPYTPYQPEVSQGTLQTIFEFQTLICQLTGLDIANASLYDGASGAAEAVLMAFRLQNKIKILIARSLHPQYKETIRTYVKNLNLSIEEIGYDESGCMNPDELRNSIDDRTSAVVFQSPNYFGTIEDIRNISEMAHQKGALSAAVVAEPVSLGLLEAPGILGADIVTGEAQSFGIPVSFGGPFLGFMSCRKEFIRQFPGRIAGETQDVEGERGYVLTLSTREQHIRRERATSNICTNQALCALRATMFLETLGQEGFKELAWQNLQKAQYAKEQLSQIKGISIKFKGNTFNEFTCEFSTPLDDIKTELLGKKIICGYGLENDFPELKNLCRNVCD